MNDVLELPDASGAGRQLLLNLFYVSWLGMTPSRLTATSSCCADHPDCC